MGNDLSGLSSVNSLLKRLKSFFVHNLIVGMKKNIDLTASQIPSLPLSFTTSTTLLTSSMVVESRRLLQSEQPTNVYTLDTTQVFRGLTREREREGSEKITKYK